MRPFRLDSWLLIVVVVGATISAGLGYLSQRQDLEGVAALTSDNTLWHAAALEREVFRFGRAIETAMIGRPDLFPDAEDPALRFEILWSRVVTARSGAIGERLAKIDKDGAVAGLSELLNRIEPQMAEFDPEALVENASLLRELAEEQQRLNALASASDRAEQEWTTQIHRRMQNSAGLVKLTGLIALSLCGLISLAIRRQARLDAARLLEIRNQARRAEAAVKTRERFLTMVSHELRTPMNGVLGMIALLKHTPLDERQAVCTHQADRSGHIMLRVVETLLDMSELRDGRLRLEPVRFSLPDLAAAIEARLAPVARTGGEELPVTIRTVRAASFVGDLSRIAQVAAHLLFHVDDVLGAKSCRCMLDRVGGDLLISILTDAPERMRWSLKSILDPDSEDDRTVATDAAGPAIARELMLLMGARAAIVPVDDEKLELRLTIPSAAIPAEPHPCSDCPKPASRHAEDMAPASVRLDPKRSDRDGGVRAAVPDSAGAVHLVKTAV